MSRNIKGNAEGNIGGFDGLSNNDNMLLSQSPGTVDYQNVNNDSTQDPYSIADVLNSGSLKGSMNVEDPLIEDIVNPSLDPEIANEPNNELMSPLISSINFDNMMHRPPSAAGMYNTGAESDHATLPTEPLRSESMLQHTSDVDSGSSLAMNKKRFLMKAHNEKAGKKKISTTRTRPAFVNKLWSMVNDNSNEKFIHWSRNGESIIVPNREKFVQEVLPKYFKHSNFASFVRQLNMYGWHKVQDIKSGSMLSNNDSRWEFENENFKRGREHLLENIIRQKPNSNLSGAGNGEDIDINILFNELETVKYNQMAIAEDLKRISKDNEMLWKENIMARERHQTQQQTLEKILRFLSSVFGPNSAKTIGNGFQPDLIHELSDIQLNNMYHHEEDPMNTVFSPMSPNDPIKLPPSDGKLRPRLLLKNRSMSGSSSNHDRNLTPPLNNKTRSYRDQALGVGAGVGSGTGAQSGSGSGSGITEITPSIVSSDSPDPTFFQDLQHNIDKQEESIQEIQDWITKLSPGDDPDTPLFPELTAPTNLTEPITGQSSGMNQPQIEEIRDAHVHEFDHSPEGEPNNGKRRKL